MSHLNNKNTSNKTFQIVDYTPEQDTWKSYIKPNAEKLLNFMNDGYQAAGKGKFLSITRAENVYRNPNLIRIAFCDNEWIAVAIYTGYRGGFKSIGITATTNPLYREIGKKAVEEIIVKNISDYKLNFWTVCSGVIEHLYAKHNGILIPSEFAELYLPATNIKGVVDDYHFYLQNNNMDEPLTKCIYGFNDVGTFNVIYNKYTKYVDDSIASIEKTHKIVNEGIVEETPKYELILCASKLSIIIDLEMEGVHELPIEKLNDFRECINKMEKLFNEMSFDENTTQHNKVILGLGKYAVDMMEPMILHKFEGR